MAAPAETTLKSLNGKYSLVCVAFPTSLSPDKLLRLVVFFLLLCSFKISRLSFSSSAIFGITREWESADWIM